MPNWSQLLAVLAVLTVLFKASNATQSQPGLRNISDGGFEEPEAVLGNATYCDAGGQVSCTHTLLARAGELVVEHRSNITPSNTGRSFHTHYADTFNASGAAPLHNCTGGGHSGAKIGVGVRARALMPAHRWPPFRHAHRARAPIGC